MKKSPHPEWSLGQAVDSPVKQMVSKKISELTPAEGYKLLIGAIVPRPIAFISTVDLQGRVNLAPFSFFNGVSSRPLCLIVSITRKSDGSKKDTLLNIEATGQFVVNTVSEWMIEPAHYCSAEYPHGVSEMEKVGLTALASIEIAPPRVKESPVHLECKLKQIVEVGDGGVGSSSLVIGEIVMAHVFDEAYENGRILFDQIKPISRLAGDTYGYPPEYFELKRPKL